MNRKDLPITLQQLEDIAASYPTPFYLYDAEAIREHAIRLQNIFSWIPAENAASGGYCNFFAIKALPNPAILQLLCNNGMGMDCSSYPELLLAEQQNISGQKIMFTSNNTPLHEYQKASKLNAIINFDTPVHIDGYFKECSTPDMASLRYNPGNLKQGNQIIGTPLESKYGCTLEQIFTGYKMLKDYGVQRFALHTMVASNELDYRYFIETADILLQLREKLQNKIGINIEMLNLGGGIGIPYRPEDSPVDLERLSEELYKLYCKYEGSPKPNSLRLTTENGRMVTGPYGYLVSRVLHVKETYKTYVGTDANMANLMRPAIYGAYHHITVPGKESDTKMFRYDVTGSLCENNDKFAIDRMLPKIAPGDLLVIHDAGAHGHSMGFNYNGKLRCAELLYENKNVTLIRRAETVDDYFRTIVPLSLEPADTTA